MNEKTTRKLDKDRDYAQCMVYDTCVSIAENAREKIIDILTEKGYKKTSDYIFVKGDDTIDIGDIFSSI